MKKVVTFGEVMMRLKPPGYSKFSQTDHLNFTFGGGEANVAIALSYMGVQSCHVTCFPDNLIGKSAEQFLKRHWVDTAHVLYYGHEMGVYFLEQGAVHRSSTVVYDRVHSSFATAPASLYNWPKILDGAAWFHWTGITPAISEETLNACLSAIKEAKKNNIKVSADLTFRKSMWQYTSNAGELLAKLIDMCDVVITGRREVELVTGKALKTDSFEEMADVFSTAFPYVEIIADKDRISKNASVNILKGKLWNNGKVNYTDPLEVTHIIDRVGTGDAYAAGLIYALINDMKGQDALDFATAACALKHTIEGDANMVSAEDVNRLASGDRSGRIIR